MHFIDWLILIVPTIFIVYIGYVTHRYSKSVAGFLAGNRVAGRYVLAVSSGEATLGLISVVGLFELYYNSGFAIGFWSSLYLPVGLIVTLTGFMIYRYRETRAMTMAQFFELRYSRRFRIFAGILAFIAGLVNYAIFPAVGARFFIYYCGIPDVVTILGIGIPSFPLIMGSFLSLALVITLIGGQLTIMVTDCVQGIFSYVGYALIVIAVLYIFSFDQFESVMMTRESGRSFVNPFDTADLRDFNLLYVFIGILASVYNRMSWQGAQGYNCAAVSAHEQKMGGVLGSWRAGYSTLMIMLLALAAYTYMHHPDFQQGAEVVSGTLEERINFETQSTTDTIRNQMLVPVAIKDFLPIGLVGVFCAMMFFLLVSTDTTYMHSWGTILVQDIILPLRKKPFKPKHQMLLLKCGITFVALFAFFFSLLYQQTTYILMFFAITGALYLGGAGAVIIGGLYWKRGTSAGAWAAMLAGLGISLSGFAFTQFWETAIYPFLERDYPLLLVWLKDGLEGLGANLPFVNWEVTPTRFPITGQEILLLTMIGAISSYIIVSLFTCKVPYNLDRMLHRGEYAGTRRVDIAPTPIAHKKQPILKRFLGFTDEYTCGDKILAWSVFTWTAIQFAVFLYIVGHNLIFGLWSGESFFLLWKYYSIGITLLIGAITTVWFTLGGIIDLRKMFGRLRVLKENVADDGRVVNHRNADEVEDPSSNEKEKN